MVRQDNYQNPKVDQDDQEPGSKQSTTWRD